MALLEVRDQFLKQSGRYDLGTVSDGSTDGSDNGADWYINAGQRLVDRRIFANGLRARRIYSLNVGDYLKILHQTKTIEAVWIIESDGSLTPLVRKDVITLRNYYLQTLNSTDNGTPLYWAPATVKLDPRSKINDIDDITIDEMGDIVIGESDEANGILIWPPTDTAVTLDILGKFFSATLTRNGDSSLWTESYPEILVMAGQYYLEVAHRNTEGAKDWMASIDLALTEVDMADVAFDSEHINQMGG